ncbi:methyltransferase domain-containing protein [Chromobacterium paludis]|uniref:Methyltransferase domain-containing protein n=1 Tax=Chromobacterium paludis TaxID=2605945 RepID=A0A5C1DDH3_9NEIS|nr:class I SAM-dependent methyltransferase [Chromobacterium paludis]QEL54782.1 methyltransferase domain-containing protein [Chromobacterium paludis]
MKLALEFLRGKGIEFGRGAHNPLAPDNCISIAPCNGVEYMEENDLDDYRYHFSLQMHYHSSVTRVDVVAEADQIPFIEDNSLDYIATSHVLEHIPDIFSAWHEWWRVLKPGGVNFMIVPKRIALEDDTIRPISSLNDFTNAFIRKIKPKDLPDMPWRGHYHVFTLQSLLDAVNWYNQQGMGMWELAALEESDTKVGNGHTLVLKKTLHLPDIQDTAMLLGQFFSDDDHVKTKEAAKQILSLNFRIHEAWFMLAIAELSTGETQAAIQAITQALILQPRNIEYNSIYQNITKCAFQYPTSLIDYYARMI